MDSFDKDPGELNPEQVANYLRVHPDFFLKRPDLLVDIEVAHPTGGAVSLLERQVSILRERNMDMRHRLNNLLDSARTNDRLFEQTKALVLHLLEATTLDQIVDIFVNSLQQDFQIDFAAMVLIGNPNAHRNVRARVVSLEDARAQIDSLLRSSKAVCGVLRPEEVKFLFPDHNRQIGSAAVVPLSYGNPLGVLAIASSDANYFRSSMGTLFLGYIAEVLNRLLPKHIKQGF
ncbi:MAG: hypothetical protein JWM78_2411 [Verrucomicrobiaceae bacterium]|nr:hypothetical protein [Verrucomicrobiaceae bacterium]